MKQKQTHNLIEVLQFCRENELPARVVGQWVWLQYKSRPSRDVLDKLKEFGFRWSKRRKQWHHNCGRASEPARDYEPWDRYPTKSLEEAFPSAP